MRGLTGGGPKEMLPVAGLPLLHRVVRECAAAGISELLVVTAPGKHGILSSLSPLIGTAGMPERIDFVPQPQPRGLADAIRLGRTFAGNDPLVVALPDNLYMGPCSGVEQVLESFALHRSNVVAVVELTPEEAARRGPTSVVEGVVEGDDARIRALSDKRWQQEPARDASARRFTAVGRYVFLPEVFPMIDVVEAGLAVGAELDDIPVLQRLIDRKRLIGRRIRGRYLNAGVPDGYREADAIMEELRVGPN